MQAWIVIRRAARNRDQQRNLLQLQLGERLAEIKLAGQSEAVNRAIAVLTEIDLVDVRVHQIGFGKARIQNDRHERFLEFAPDGLTVIEKITANELLRERR